MEDKKNELKKTDGWAVGRGETPFLTTPECTKEPTHTQTYAHSHGSVQVLFMGLAPLQRGDKGLEGEDGEKKNRRRRDGENTK